MTAYAIGRPAWRLLTPGETIIVGDEQFSYNTMLGMTEEQRQARGIHAVEPQVIPVGQRKAGDVPSDTPGGPRWQLEAVPEVAVPVQVITYKKDIWVRATDAEADTIEQVLAQQSTRKQRIFADAQYLDHADPLFAELRGGFEAAFGKERASQLLAGS